jgi:glycosyltransferase involved in cell wall biosynthesis
MRIAICTPYHTQKKVAGGGAVIVRYLMEALRSQNIEVILWLFRDYKAPIEVQSTASTSESPECWEFIGLPPQMAFSLKKSAPKDFETLREQTSQLQNENAIDAVIIFSPVTPGFWPMELAESLNIPYVLTLLDYSFLCPTFTRYNYQGQFCQGIIPESTCLECSISQIPSAKRPIFKLLRLLPESLRSFIGRNLRPLFPAYGRYHAGSESDRTTRRHDMQSLFARSAAVIYQSSNMQAHFHQASWQHPHEYIECYGVPENDQKSEKRVAYLDEVIHFVYLSRPTKEWGINFLLQTWAKNFVNKGDRQLTILSPNISNLLSQHPEWKDLSNVDFSEEVIQGRVAEFHAKFHVLILPAQWQGVVALTALEALAHGTVVIEPDLGGLSGYAENSPENIGLSVYEWNNPESLANCIDDLCNGRAKLGKLMSASRQLRSLETWGDRYVQIFQQAKSLTR